MLPERVERGQGVEAVNDGLVQLWKGRGERKQKVEDEKEFKALELCPNIALLNSTLMHTLLLHVS